MPYAGFMTTENEIFTQPRLFTNTCYVFNPINIQERTIRNYS